MAKVCFFPPIPTLFYICGKAFDLLTYRRFQAVKYFQAICSDDRLPVSVNTLASNKNSIDWSTVCDTIDKLYW